MDSSGFEAWDRQEIFFFSVMSRPGTGVAQLVEALCHKSEGRGFDPRYCHWNFSLRHSFRQNYGTEVDSDSNGNEYREYFLEGKGGRYRQLYQLCVPIASKSGSSNSWKPMGLYRDCPNFGIYHASPPPHKFYFHLLNSASASDQSWSKRPVRKPWISSHQRQWIQQYACRQVYTFFTFHVRTIHLYFNFNKV